MPVFQVEADVTVLEGAQAVGNDKGGPTFHQPVDGFHDPAFGDGIDGAGGFIQNEDRGILEEGPGQGNTLALSSGEAHAPIAHWCLVAFGQR